MLRWDLSAFLNGTTSGKRREDKRTSSEESVFREDCDGVEQEAGRCVEGNHMSVIVHDMWWHALQQTYHR